MIETYLAEYDFDLPIEDAAADPELPAPRARLALLARGEGLDSAYYQAQELAEAFLDMAREANAGNEDPESPARERMTDILDRAEGYQRALYDEVAALPLSEAAAHLCWLAELMKNRADMYRPVMAVRNKGR